MKKLVSLLLAVCFVWMAGCTTAEGEPEKSAAESGAKSNIQTQEPTIYPKNFDNFADVDISKITEPPEIIFTTPASENGFGGTMYKINGEVIKVVPNEYSEDVYGYFVVKTDYGEIVVIDLTLFIIDNGGAGYGLTKEDISKYFDIPEVGENVCVYAEYAGFSDVYKKAAANYGGSEYVKNIIALELIKKYGSAEALEPEPEPEAEPEPEPIYTIEDLKRDLDGSLGDGGTITSVRIENRLENRILKITGEIVTNHRYLPASSIAWSAVGSITDIVLEHNEFDKEWDKINIDFGAVGNVTLGKDSIRTNVYGRYMDTAAYDSSF